jgi:hypothetical protein
MAIAYDLQKFEDFADKRMMIFQALFTVLAIATVPTFARADVTDAWPNGLTRTRFETLATEFAPKVNLFAEVWKQVPEARFTGGTVRDYLYWVRMKLAAAPDPASLEKAVADLRASPMIDVRDFVHDESDIDYAAPAGKRAKIEVADFGVKKLDAVDEGRFVPGTEAYVSEIDQGYISIEKMLLGPKNLSTATGFGEGITEVFSGKPTVHFTSLDQFSRTFYAKVGANHRILLVMRYLRTLSLNYAKTGHALSEYPNLETLLRHLDTPTRAKIAEIVGDSVRGPGLSIAFKNASFTKWYRATLEKSFRAYVHPTATYLLYTHFGLDRIVQRWPDQSIQINQFAYAKPRLPRHIAEFDRKIRAFGFEPSEILEPAEHFFGPNRRLFHGTRTDEAFHDIVLRGVISSTNGTAGGGVYGVTETNREFAITWAGDRNRLVEFEIARHARVLDFTSSRESVRKFVEAVRSRSGGVDYDALADEFGLDVIKYPYTTDAFVVKNGGALGRPVGVFRTVLSFGQATEQASRIRSTRALLTFLEGLSLSRSFTTAEWGAIFDAMDGLPAIQKAMREINARAIRDSGAAKALFVTTHALMRGISEGLDFQPSATLLQRMLLDPSVQLSRTRADLRFFSGLIDRTRPANFDSKMRTRLLLLLDKGKFDSFAGLKTIFKEYQHGIMPWQVIVGIHTFLAFTTAHFDSISLPFAGSLLAIVDVLYITANWKENWKLARTTYLNDAGMRSTRSLIQSLGLRGPSNCTDWLTTPMPDVP